MNKLFLFVLFSIFLINIQAQSYTLTDNDVTVVDGVITECTYDFTIKDIVIPDELDGQTIVEIGDYLFKEKEITGIILPSGIQKIGWSAFTDNNISELTLPNGIIEIESNAFIRNNINELTLPANIEIISAFAFGSNNISEIIIPASVKFLGSYSFDNNNITSATFLPNSNIQTFYLKAFVNNSISTITLPTNTNENFVEYVMDENTYTEGAEINLTDGIIYARTPYTLKDEDVVVENGTLKSCSYDFSSKYIIIPDELDGQTVTNIDSNCFRSKGIKELKLPNKLERIGSYEFNNNDIKTISLPSTLKDLEIGAFSNNNITSINLPKSLKILKKQVFLSNEISEVEIPSTITTIESTAFGRNQLNQITFAPNSSIQVIYLSAFWGNNITEIELPSHSDQAFVEYADETTKFAPGSMISIPTDISNDFIYAVVPYTLKDDDVIVEDGVLKSCTFGFDSKCITIPETLDNQNVIEIGQAVFEKQSLTNLQLPSTLKKIGYYAFRENNIIQVTLPVNLETIMAYAFNNNRLSAISVPNKISVIENESFSRNNITSYTLPNHANENFVEYTDGTNAYQPGDEINNFEISIYAGIEHTLTDDDVSVENGILTNCSYSFESNYIKIPDVLHEQNIIEIARAAFYRKRIINLTLPTNLLKIGENAFYDCNIEKVTLPSNLEEIGEQAFSSNSITNITIPNSIVTIKKSAFSNYNLANVNFESNSNIQFIGANAFNINAELKISLPSHSNPDFQSYTNGVDNFPAGYLLSDFSQPVYTIAPYTLTDEDVEIEDGILKTCSYNFESKYIIIPNELDGQSITGIANEVFYDKGITHVELPNNLAIIGESAFYDNSISNINFPSSLREIKSGAFCKNSITKLDLPSNCERTGASSFSSNLIESISLPNTLLVIGSHAFSNNLITSINIPTKLNSIESGAFSNNNLTKIVIPKNVKIIDNYSFNNNAINTVEFEDESNIQLIGDYAFGNNSSLEITLPTHSNPSFEYYTDGETFYFAGNTIIDPTKAVFTKTPYTFTNEDVVVENGAIVSCSYSFESKFIIIPDELDGQIIKTIEREVFQNKRILEIKLPNFLTEIKTHALSGNEIKRLSLPQNLRYLGWASLSYNNIELITIPNSIEFIDEHVFSSNDDIEIIFLQPSRLLYISENAFIGHEVELPTSIYSDFDGYKDNTGSKWQPNASIDSNKSYQTDAVYTLDDSDVIIKNDTIKEYISSYCHHKIKIPSSLQDQSVKAIDDGGIFQQKKITTLKLPYTLEYVGDYAFYVNKISFIEIPGAVKYIGKYAFCNSSTLNVVSFDINSHIQQIGEYAFCGNDNLPIELPQDNTNDGFLGYKAKNSSNIFSTNSISDHNYSYTIRQTYTLQDEDVVVTDGVIVSVRDDFYENDIIIPNQLDGQTITGIASNAFESKEIISLELPNTIEQIGEKAFYNNKLSTVLYPASIKHIESQAFYGSNSLNQITFEDNSALEFIGGSAFSFSDNNKTITLPTSSNPLFIHYYYNEAKEPGVPFELPYGNSITMVAYHELTSEDVVVENGFIIEYNSTQENIFIPTEIDNQTIIGIGEKAFKQKNIQRIILPETIEEIQYEAFMYNSLEEIIIPRNIVRIGSYAFKNNNLKTVNFEDNSSIMKIGKHSFSDNELNHVLLPTHTHSDFVSYKGNFGLTLQPKEPFIYFTNRIYADIPYELTDDDVIVEDGIVVSYNHNPDNNHIIIPNELDGQEIKYISNSFSNKYIGQLELPKTLKKIESYSLINNSMSEIIIPASVDTIESSSFYSIFDLKNITFEPNSNISYIAKNAFSVYFQESLQSLILPIHNSNKFLNYKDENEITYSEGDEITAIEASYSTIFSPTQISFDGNDHSIGDVPTSVTKTYGEQYLIPDGVGFRKFEHKFQEWNTKNDGTGESFKGGDEIVVGPEDITLYAIWDKYIGISDINTQIKKVYPNPANGYFTIIVQKKLVGTYLSLYNSMGFNVKQIKITSTKTNTNISDLPAGVYMLMKDKQLIEKLIIK